MEKRIFFSLWHQGLVYFYPGIGKYSIFNLNFGYLASATSLTRVLISLK